MKTKMNCSKGNILVPFINIVLDNTKIDSVQWYNERDRRHSEIEEFSA